MKGTDIPESELRIAEEFLRVSNNVMPERFIATRDKTVRLLAWYGWLRSNGDGSGHFVVAPKEAAESNAERARLLTGAANVVK